MALIKFSVYCPRCGEKMPLFRAPTSARQALLGGWTCPKCGCEMNREGRELAGKFGGNHSSVGAVPPDLRVSLLARQRVPIANEEVRVPTGVTVKVKRSRTVEHTIEVNWNVSLEGSLDTSIMEMVNLSARAAIERQQGKTYRDVETMEYEIELNGREHNRYVLAWADIWREGLVEFSREGKVISLPLRFREAAELEVIPVAGG